MKITLCGSARFEREFQEWSEKLTLAGHVVYSLAVLPSFHGGDKDWYKPHEKELLDLVHLAKIEESDAVVVVNVGGYVGESTRREVRWAFLRGKTVFWVEYQKHADVPKFIRSQPATTLLCHSNLD